ncbi:MAG: response regulator transcription factor [Williamsia sp.]|nr:response regulator transcription factor [Williamsia sp.]
MIRAIVIDDEQSCVDSLCFDLEKCCPDVQVLECCTSPKQGILAIRKRKPDLVFLDVQMPWMNGFEMLELIDEKNFSVIFTTAFDQFAVRAFRISAVDYLLKPIDVTELKEAVQKVAEKINPQTGPAHIENLLQNIQKPEASRRIAFRGRESYEFIEPHNILYAHAEGAYSHIILTSGKKLVISKTLSDIEEMLPPSHFQRIHHSSLVNINHVTHFFKTDGGYVVLDGGEKLAVSNSKKEALMEKLGLK